MNVLVTGGAGYIGSVLVPALLKEGHEVTVVDSFIFNQASLLDAVHDKHLHVVRGDVRDEGLMRAVLPGKDFVLPLACLVGDPLCKARPIDARTVNLDAIKTLINIRNKENKILFPTTNSGYGVGQEGIFCTEHTPLRPISLYGRLKVEAEKILLEAGDVITLRLATVFGMSPRMRLDLLVNDFTYRAVTDRSIVLFESHFKRNYIHIRDVASVFIHSINNFDGMKNEPYNVGLSRANLSKKELCLQIKKHIPGFTIIESNVGEDPDKRNYIVSNEKIERTGFTPRYSLDDGIEELIKGYSIIKKNAFGNV